MATRKSREIEQSASASASASSASPAPQPKKSSKRSSSETPAKSARASKGERSSRKSTAAATPAASDSAPAKEPRARKTVYVLEAADESRDAVPTFVPLPEENTTEELLGHLTRLAGLMRTMAASVSQLVTQVTSAHKRVVREGNRKRHKRVVDPNKPKTLSTFTCRMKVRPELLKFMGLPKNSYVSRVDATEAITKYISSHNLRIKEGPKAGTIQRDAALNKILSDTAQKKQKPGDTSAPVMYTDVTSKNLQAFLSHNYLEKAPEDQQPTIAEVEQAQARRLAEKSAKTEAARGSAQRATKPAKESRSSSEKKSSRKTKAAAPVESDDSE
jgi:hypothetical protein